MDLNDLIEIIWDYYMRHLIHSIIMRRSSIIVAYLFISAAFVICRQTPADAEGSKKLESRLSVGVGWESLCYKECAVDMGVASNAHVNNTIADIEGLKRWKSLFSGIKAIIPVLQEKGNEKWTDSSKTLQNNTLEYGWTRLDGYMGYPLNYFVNPYGGLRWSETKQERKDFILLGSPTVDTAIEKVKSWSLLLGIRGEGNFTPRWEWNYWVEYFFPIYVEVSNSVFPDFEASDKGGYTLDIRGGIEYCYTETLSLGILFYGGKMHREGSISKPYIGGSVKWPENDTNYLGGILNISWIF